MLIHIQQQLVSKENPLAEQQEPEPPDIKEEQWSSEDRQQLQGLEEADIPKFSFTAVPVKMMKRNFSPHSFIRVRLRTTETEPLTSNSAQHIEIGAHGKDCGGQQTDGNSHPDSRLEPDNDERTSHI